jgi:hypothetical protein
MSTQTIYIPNLTGGQAIQIVAKGSGVFSIAVDSFASRGLTLEDLGGEVDGELDDVDQTRPGTPGSMTSTSSSSSSDYIPDDAF